MASFYFVDDVLVTALLHEVLSRNQIYFSRHVSKFKTGYFYLRVQWEIVEYHWADEGDLRRLGVHDLLLGVHPQTGKFGEDINHLE